ncbi:MAG TPA: Xaa-Pro peptidase family protein [Terriglobales bacterium]|nr:Xaa-Pro peptidase family protein [Terriglobales bacterium]
MMRLRVAMSRCVLTVLAVAACSVLVNARFRQPNNEYQGRRTKLRSMVDGPVVIFGYTSKQEAGEVAVFFQEESFYYLTGYSEPDAALLLIPDLPNGKAYDGPSEILYLPPRDARRAKWEGPKMGPEDPGVPEGTGFSTVRPFPSLRDDLLNAAKKFPNFYTLLPPREERGYPHLATWSAWVRELVPEASVSDVLPMIRTLREVKSAGEIALLQKAVDASVEAQMDAMKQMRPGLYEYQVAARMRMIHEMAGCSREAYAPIVGAGFYSTVLHYDALDNEIKDGDVVVIDVGGEYGGYAADITRTLPANGKFTPRQREIYEIVLGAQNAALDAIKPGVQMSALQKIAYDYINTHGHDKQGELLGKYFIHGLGHGLGLDVHDPTDYQRPLRAGMAITDEPGIYIPEENLGVRIEDDVLITEDGHRLMTERLPRTVEEVEKVMAEGREHAEVRP